MNYSVFLISDISGPRNKVQFEQLPILREIKDFARFQNPKKISRGLLRRLDWCRFRAASGPAIKSTMIVTRNTRCITTRLLTNSFVQAPYPFPFHSFYEAIQKSFVNRPINRLGLETNFQRVEGMAHQAHSNATECSRHYVFQSSPDKWLFAGWYQCREFLDVLAMAIFYFGVRHVGLSRHVISLAKSGQRPHAE